MNPKTLLQRLDECPPFFVYALARIPKKKKGRKRPSVDQLSELSGIPVRTFARIARRLTWEGVKLKHVDDFCRACNVDLLRMSFQRVYLRRTFRRGQPLFHLSPKQLQDFNVLSTRWVALREAKASEEP